MSTQVETTPALGQISGSNVGAISGSWLKMAATLIDLGVTFTAISTMSTALQNKLTDFQNDATRSQGKKQAMANWAQMGANIGTAIADGATTGYSTYSNSKSLTDLGNEQAILGKAKGLLGNVQDVQSGLGGAGFDRTVGTNPQVSAAVEARTSEMLAGKFDSNVVSVPATAVDDSGVQLTKEAFDKKVIESMNTDELSVVKEQLSDQVNNATLSSQKATNQMTSNDTTNRAIGELVKAGVVQAPSQGVQAHSAEAAANKRAEETSMQYDANVESQIGQKSMQTEGEDVQAAMQALQGLAQQGSAAAG